MSELPVVITIDGTIATIRLNRPGGGNAIDLPTARALVEATTRCDTDASIRCVVLTGTGRLFCAGGDINAFSSAGDQLPALLSELAGTLHMAVARLMRMPKPLLCLVNGPAAGAGLSLAISGDIVLCAETAHFTAAYGAVGLTPDGGQSWMLPRLIGLRRAQEMLITNKRIGSQTAEQIGLVTRCVPDDELDAEGAKMAQILANSSTSALAGARALMLESASGGLETHLERETRSISAAGGSSDGREGIAAFLSRRAPDFSGSKR